jgi:hypothetical protein
MFAVAKRALLPALIACLLSACPGSISQETL